MAEFDRTAPTAESLTAVGPISTAIGPVSTDTVVLDHDQAALDRMIVQPEVLAAVEPPVKPVRERKVRLARNGLPDAHKQVPANKDFVPGKGNMAYRKAIDATKRAVVRAALTSGEELPLHVMLDNMRWAMKRARAEEKLLVGVETAAAIAQIVSYRHLGQAAAEAAAPFLHARLAPIVPKGEKGLTVQLIIEDA